MSVRQGKAEIPDSEDEPMTSSPVKVSDAALDHGSPQDAQDAQPAANYPHQVHSKHVDTAVSDLTKSRHIDSDNTSKDIDASKALQINMQPNNTMPQEGPTVETSALDLEPKVGPDEDAPCEPNAIIDQNHRGQSSDTNFSNGIPMPNKPGKEASIESAHRGLEAKASAEAMAENPAISQEVPQAHAEALSAEQNTSIIAGVTEIQSDETLQYQAHGTDNDIVAGIAVTSSPTPSKDVPHSDEPMNIATNDSELCDPSPKAETASQELDHHQPEMVDEGEKKTTACDIATTITTIGHDSTPHVQSSNVHNADQTATQTVHHTHASEEHRPTDLAPTASRPTPPKSSQEITLAELKAQKAALLASLATLPAIQVLMEETASSQMELSDDEPTDTDIMAAANKIVKDHIKLLHEYNELKDVGQGLMGLIADQRGVRIVEVQDEFGIDAKD